MLTRPFRSLKMISLSVQRLRAALSPRTALWVLGAVAATSVALWSFVPLQHGLLLTLIAAWFTLPGVIFARFVYDASPGRGLAAVFVGPVWGYGASSIVLLAMWTAGVRGPALLLAPLVAGAILAACAVPLRGALSPPAFRAADVVAVCILVILTAGIIARPFSRVASPLPDGGRAYRAYFTADFIWRMAVAAELAKGDVPPVNPFHSNDYLHYYWLPHLLPAAEYREMRGAVSLEQILLANSVALDVTFVMFLYGFCRQWVRSPTALTAACAATLLCSSFEGIERLYYLWRDGGALDSLRMLNIDAMSRWIYRSLPVDGLHRVLWYQPHHATGYALGFSAMLVLVQARVPTSVRVFALSGGLLACCLMLSTFSAIMLSAVASVVALVLLVPRGAWRTLLPAALAAAVPLGLATAAAMALGYVDRNSGGLVRVLVNPMAITEPVWAIFLSFGPLLLLSIVGTVVAVRRRATGLLAIAAIIVVSFAFYFFVDLRGHQYVYVGWRAGHLLFVAFTVLTAYALQEIGRDTTARRAMAAAVFAVLALSAVPTFAIDLYNTQDIDNREQGMGFRWTLVLDRDELEALAWIRAVTPQDAVVQIDPFPRDAYTWAYIPAFAERRMAAGLPISMVPLEKYENASREVKTVFTADSGEAAHKRAVEMGIDYLFIGQPEREANPQLVHRLGQRPDLFQPVFHNNTISIYFVERPAGEQRGE
jgi:hypothetical protein